MTGAQEIDSLVSELAQSSQEQTNGIVEVNKAIGSIDGAVQANAQTLDVMRNEFVQLGVITEELQHSLSKFRV